MVLHVVPSSVNGLLTPLGLPVFGEQKRLSTYWSARASASAGRTSASAGRTNTSAGRTNTSACSSELCSPVIGRTTGATLAGQEHLLERKNQCLCRWR